MKINIKDEIAEKMIEKIVEKNKEIKNKKPRKAKTRPIYLIDVNLLNLKC